MMTLTEAASRLVAVCGKETRDVIVPAVEWANFVQAWEAAMTPSMAETPPPVEEPPPEEPPQDDDEDEDTKETGTLKIKKAKGRARKRY